MALGKYSHRMDQFCMTSAMIWLRLDQPEPITSTHRSTIMTSQRHQQWAIASQLEVIKVTNRRFPVLCHLQTMQGTQKILIIYGRTRIQTMYLEHFVWKKAVLLESQWEMLMISKNMRGHWFLIGKTVTLVHLKFPRMCYKLWQCYTLKTKS